MEVIAVKHNLRRLEEDLGLYPEETMAAGVRAMNRTLARGRRSVVDDLKALFPGLKVGTLNRQIKLERASRSRAAALEFSANRLRLVGNFIKVDSIVRRGNVQLRRAPWRIEALDGETVLPEELRRGFLQRSRRGAVHVWIRVGSKRYPITALVAASLATTLAERRMIAPLVARMHARFTEVLAQEAKYSLHRRSL